MLSHSQVLILAPLGRDAEVAASLLKEIGVTGRICPDLEILGRSLNDNVSLCIVTEETVRSADLRLISDWVDRQPAWSDLAFIVLTHHGGGLERNPGAARLSDVLGNVAFLERPFHPTTFVSVVRVALKGRRRQYEARARLAELHEGEQRLQTALLAGDLGSWELDLETMALSTSDTCREQFGRKKGDVFDYDSLMSAIHPMDRQKLEAVVETSVEADENFATDFRHIWPDGSEHWLEIRTRIVHNQPERKRRLVGVSLDITERKANENRLRSLNEMLEERVAERTGELQRAHAKVLAEIEQRERAEEQLRQAQKMEMIGQLTGGVAHDFNNLLMAVLGNLELLRKRFGEDPRASRQIQGAIEGARRGASLTQRLLAFARRQDLKVEPRNLIDLIRGMTDLLERSAGPETELVMDLPRALPLALVDGNQVELALLNLVVNARDAMPAGGTVTISAKLVAPEAEISSASKRYICLTVRDTGQGMDEETLKRATEPFFSTKELGKGTGLGLSMIQGLAVQLDGFFRLRSSVGQGTTAEFWVPATDMVLAPSLDEPVAAEVPEKSQPLTILIVDDDNLIAMSTVDMLEDLGHKVFEANSAEDALMVLRRASRIDLMITDYSMPKMTGLQLAKAARALKPDLPILLASGYAELPSDTIVDLPRLAKPYQQSQLVAEIGKLVGFR